MNLRNKLIPRFCLLILSVSTLVACATAPRTESGRATLDTETQTAIEVFKRTDTSMTALFDEAYGYAVFPSVGKGAVGIGGAFGRGVTYQGGAKTGYCSLTQGTIGFQWGGQNYQQVIFFENERSYNRFVNEELEFSAQASAVAATTGASATTDYSDGTMVFTQVKGGLMYEASIGGQKFNFASIQ